MGNNASGEAPQSPFDDGHPLAEELKKLSVGDVIQKKERDQKLNAVHEQLRDRVQPHPSLRDKRPPFQTELLQKRPPVPPI